MCKQWKAQSASVTLISLVFIHRDSSAILIVGDHWRVKCFVLSYLRKIISQTSVGFEPATFEWLVQHSNHWATRPDGSSIDISEPSSSSFNTTIFMVGFEPATFEWLVQHSNHWATRPDGSSIDISEPSSSSFSTTIFIIWTVYWPFVFRWKTQRSVESESDRQSTGWQWAADGVRIWDTSCRYE